ncbi:AI-2E family transporter [Rudanella lutea]|uniref:AI-2E family transporter n=1 Tax=Rudanella lutea TaxID=451374 RepID=UPI001FDF7261|nr:AI-2E family transporter [Rudanella lutea]
MDKKRGRTLVESHRRAAYEVAESDYRSAAPKACGHPVAIITPNTTMKALSLSQVNTRLAFAVLGIGILYLGRPFLVPLAFAGILSLLFMPVSNWLERRGIGRIWATLLCVLLFLMLIGLFVGVIYAQAASFSKDWPQIQTKLTTGIEQAQAWIQQQFGVSRQRQLQALKEGVSKLSSASSGSLTAVFGGLSGFLTGLVLVVLYLFFLLWKREKYKAFVLKLAAPENRPAVNDALSQISSVSAQYLSGRLVSMGFLALFYSIGLSIVGVENAILMSLVAVIPTLIPYIGAFVGGAFPLFMALVSGSPDMLLPTLVVLVSAQVIDNNIIEPLVMGAQLDLSPIFTIIAIVLGELIWGVPGMILFEPLFAVIRIVCAHIPTLHPYAFLLENEVEEPGWVKAVKKKIG